MGVAPREIIRPGGSSMAQETAASHGQCSLAIPRFRDECEKSWRLKRVIVLGFITWPSHYMGVVQYPVFLLGWLFSWARCACLCSPMVRLAVATYDNVRLRNRPVHYSSSPRKLLCFTPWGCSPQLAPCTPDDSLEVLQNIRKLWGNLRCPFWQCQCVCVVTLFSTSFISSIFFCKVIIWFHFLSTSFSYSSFSSSSISFSYFSSSLIYN